MREDLLDAQAAVDWAVSQNQILHQRLVDFVNSKPYTLAYEIDPESGQKVTKLAKVDPVPRLIKAEVGAIIHSIRSSLDVLASSLAERAGVTNTKDVYFPVSANEGVFLNKGLEKIERLSQAHIGIIKNLKPYKGGNDLLYALHQIDITRKHTRLIAARGTTRRFRIASISSDGGGGAFFVRPNQAVEEGAIFVRGQPESDYKVDLTIQVAFSEAGIVSGKPVIGVLHQFASLANSIIVLFDDP